MKAIVSRLREPSTMAGLSALAAMFMPPELAAAGGQVAAGLLAVLAVVLPEGQG